MTDVQIARSPLLRQYADRTTDPRELVDGWTARVLRGRRQLVVHEKRAPHVHLGTCMARPGTLEDGGTYGAYDVRDCDCGGPAIAQAQIKMVRELLNLWTDATRERRLGMIPMVGVALAGLGPELESCPRCVGTRPKHECDRCHGVGVSERRIAE